MQTRHCKPCFGLYLICIYVLHVCKCLCLLGPPHQEFLTSIPQLFWHHFRTSGDQYSVEGVGHQLAASNQSQKKTQKVPPNPLTCQKPSQHILAQSSVTHRDLKGRWWFIGRIYLHTNCNEQSGQLWEGVLGLQLLESLTFWKDLLHFLELKIGQICQKQHNKWKNMKAPVAPVKSRKRKQETTKNILYLNHTEDTT